MSSESDGEGKVLRGFRELGTLNRLSPEIRSQSHIGPKIRVWGHRIEKLHAGKKNETERTVASSSQ